MSNIKRTVERENLSAVFFCEFFYSKIVYMEEKIREGCGSDQGKSQNAVRSRSHIFGCMCIGRRRYGSRNFEYLRVAFSLLQPANKKSILKLKKVKKLYRLKIRH